MRRTVPAMEGRGPGFPEAKEEVAEIAGVRTRGSRVSLRSSSGGGRTPGSACRGPRHADGASALRQTPRPGRAVPAGEELDRPLSYDRGPHPRPWRNKKMRLTNEQQAAWERDGFLGIEELL